MSNIILSDLQILLRQTHEQVQAVEHAHDRLGSVPGQYIVELRKFRQCLFKELDDHGVLPTEPDRDREDLKALAAKVVDAVDANPDRWIEREETRLYALTKQLNDEQAAISDPLRQRVEQIREILAQRREKTA